MLAFQRAQGGSERAALREALREPWCRPQDPALRAELEGWLGGALPVERELRGCEALLVTVAPDSRSESGRLWRLNPGDASRPGQIGFARQALEAANAARQAASSAATDYVPSVDWVAWHATDIPFPIGRTDLLLDGASFGLAIALAIIAVRYDARLPRDFVASGALGADGSIRAVKGLEEKVRVVASVALGVSRILVAHDVKEEVQGYVRSSARPSIEVIGLTNVADAAQAVGLDRALTENLDARFRQGPESLVRRFLQGAFAGGVPADAWRAFAHTARRVADLVGDGTADPGLFLRARWAEKVALRHTGHAAPLDPEELLPQQGPEQRTRALAHAIQSIADSESDATADARAALSRVPKELSERSPADAELLGAIGRALASAGHVLEACNVLRDACATWQVLNEENRSTFPVCELVRLLAIHDPNALRAEITSRVDPLLTHWQLESSSKSFLDLTLGRAHIMLGDHDRAVPLLEDLVGRVGIRPDVRASSLRWLARARAGMAASTAARDVRSALRREFVGDPTLAMFVRIAELDDALEAHVDKGDRVLEVLECLERDATGAPWGFEVRRTLRVLRGRALMGIELARALADEFRY